MLSFPLLKIFLKNTWKLWAIFVGILLMYMLIMVFTFDQMREAMQSMEVMGLTVVMDSRFDMLASMYFDMIVFMFPMIFYIILANKLVSKTVDDKSMSSFLSSSLSRRQYTVTAALFLVASIVAMFFVVFAVGGLSLIMFETINWANWMAMLLTTLTCTLAIASLCFFFSTVFAANKTGNTFMVGIPVMFFLLMFLGEIPSLEFLHYLTPFGYVDSFAIAHGVESLWWLINLVFIVIATVFLTVSIYIFDKKQLSI